MPDTALNFVTFNQDDSCLAVGTSKGFRIFHTDPFNKIFSSDDGDITIIEMLFSTSLVAIILSPRHLIIQNTKRASIICELTFPSAVLAVRLNRKRLSVVLEDEIYLYDISNMSLLTNIATSPNPNKIVALSPSSENCYLAYPLPKPREDTPDKRPSHAPPASLYAPVTTGDVLIYDTLTLKAVNVIEAHRSPLSFIEMNSDGTLLATASETGTIIRVFSVPKGHKLFQFRRGTYPSTIYSMSFNMASSLLCVSSTTDTVHIFRLQQPQQNQNSIAASDAAAATTSPRAERWTRGRSYDSGNDSPSSTTGSPPATPPNRDSLRRQRRTTTIGDRRRRRGGQLPPADGDGNVGADARLRLHQASQVVHRRLEATAGRGGAGGAPGQQLRSVVAMSSTSPQVMVVTNDGGFYVYNIDMEQGGEGYLVKQYSYVDPSSVLGGDDKLDSSSYGP
ncbi:hypothetical protein PG999_001673 [Apiospora kogelbergensis]|uniref:Autophagy-related protein 18 n=1 Tax=Apiospora kogelbergensis TaxID=1337665 RepID=A0AAW0R662_9PEZI